MLTNSGKVCGVIVQYCYTGVIKFYDMEPNTLIDTLNEFIVRILQKFYKIILIIDINFIIINIFSIQE